MPYPETNLHIIKTGFYNSQFVYKQMSQSPDRKVEYYELEYFPESGGVSYINGQAYPIVQSNVLVAAPAFIIFVITSQQCVFSSLESANSLVSGYGVWKLNDTALTFFVSRAVRHTCSTASLLI